MKITAFSLQRRSNKGFMAPSSLTITKEGGKGKENERRRRKKNSNTFCFDIADFRDQTKEKHAYLPALS